MKIESILKLPGEGGKYKRANNQFRGGDLGRHLFSPASQATETLEETSHHGTTECQLCSCERPLGWDTAPAPDC